MAKEQQKEPDLSRIKTRELVEELRKREGVETKIAGPYENITVTVNGPAIVLSVVLVVMD